MGAWENVPPRSGRLRGRVSVFKNGRAKKTGKQRLALNISAYKHKFAAVSYVKIKRSRRKRKLLVLPAKRARNAYKIQRRGDMVFIACGAVLAEMRVKPGRYRARWSKKLGGLIINFAGEK